MFDALVTDLSQRYGLGDRGRDLFGLLMGYIHNDRRGGFAGFVENFREQGHGELLSSWLGDPASQRGIGPAEVGTVFGQGLLNDWGTRLGISRATLAAAIAGVLPRLVAELTPGGRLPGGLSPATPYDWPARDATFTQIEAATAREATGAPANVESERVDAAPATPRSDATSFSVRPGVEGLIAPASERPLTHRVPVEPRLAAAVPLGEVVPGEERRPIREVDAFDTNLRRDPAPAPARREPNFDAERADPGAQRIADMAAAFDAPARARADSGSIPSFDVRPPRAQRRSGAGWLIWLLLILAVLAGAGWFAWEQGLLDPYVQQYGLPLPLRNAPAP